MIACSVKFLLCNSCERGQDRLPACNSISDQFLLVGKEFIQLKAEINFKSNNFKERKKELRGLLYASEQVYRKLLI